MRRYSTKFRSCCFGKKCVVYTIPYVKPPSSLSKSHNFCNFGDKHEASACFDGREPCSTDSIRVFAQRNTLSSYFGRNRLNSIDHDRVLRILSERDWFFSLNREFKPHFKSINPRFVVMIFQNGENPTSMLKFYMWVSSFNTRLAKDSSVRRVLSDFLCRKGPIILSTDLLKEIKCNGYEMTEDLLCILIKSWGKLGLANYALEVFGQMPKLGIKPSTQVYNTIIDALVKSNSLDSAYLKFQQMGSHGCKPDHFTYNTLIYGTCKNGIVSEAVRLLKQMENIGLSPNIFTYTILIDGFCKSNKVEEAIEMLNMMKTRNISPSEATYRSLVHGLFNCSVPNKAYKIICDILENEQVLQKDTCNTLLYCLCKHGMAKEIQDFVQKMGLRGFVPDTNTFGTVISCCMKQLGFSESRELFDNFVKSGGKPGFSAYISILQGLLRERNILEVNKFSKIMDLNGLFNSADSYNTLIDLFVKNNEMDMAMKISHEMREKGFHPNLVTFNTLISGYSKLGDVKKVQEILKILLENGFQPDKYTLTSIIDGLCRASQLNDALNCFNEMFEWGVSPNSFTYNILIRSFSEIGYFSKATRIFNRMKGNGIKPDLYSFNALISNFCRVGEVNKARNLFHAMLRFGIVPDQYTYNTFIRVLCNENRIEEAKEVLVDMESNGCDPNPFSLDPIVDSLRNMSRFDEAQELLDRYGKG